MPPKRPTAASSKAAPKKRPLSKLAKELKLTSEEELEVREAFSLFCEDDADDVIPTKDVRKAMLALGFDSPPHELSQILDTLDPEKEGIVFYDGFIRVCALKMKYRDDAAELERAYHLFTNNTPGPITIEHLRNIARELKMEKDVTEEMLEDMLYEASGSRGGVSITDFEGVMRRAGVL